MFRDKLEENSSDIEGEQEVITLYLDRIIGDIHQL
jgi:hypothetical protein